MNIVIERRKTFRLWKRAEVLFKKWPPDMIQKWINAKCYIWKRRIPLKVKIGVQYRTVK